MDRPPVSSPVVMIIFNRPDTTARVFAEVARARPSQLLVIADGPRSDRPGEAEQCAATRTIVQQVDWPCDVLTNFSDVNIGCKARVSSGLDWVFECVKTAIILEDDCIPHPSFFRFCDELLDHYSADERIMMISGDNFQDGKMRGSGSYYFSRYCHIWGWASWRRAWQHCDVAMADWPTMRDGDLLHELLDNRGQARRWSEKFDIIHSGVVDTWDVQWMYTCWRQRGLSIVPNVNLISNIGFRPDATHTKNASDRFAELPATSIGFPLRHPPAVSRDVEADLYTERHMFHVPWSERVRRAAQKLLAKARR